MTEQTALATREQHPIIEHLDKREAALAEMLPGGERAAQRFKRVVTQAIVRTPALMECTQSNAGMASLMSAVMESATLGIEPTGVLGGAHLVPYKGKAQLIIGYRGLIELARRSGEIETIEARVVREGDDFSYAYGTDPFVRHTPRIGGNAALTFVYGVAKLRGGSVQFEVMTREQVDAIRNESSGYKYAESSGKRNSPWHTSYDEMARKTVVRRLVKYLPIAVEARDVIERDDEREFERDAVVARVSADERTGQVRSRIRERTAALRGRSIEQGESEGSGNGAVVPDSQPPHGGGSPVESPVYDGEVLDIDDVPFDDASGTLPEADLAFREPADPKIGDPWMRRIHAVGAERGMDHDALHEYAAEHFGVDSMSALDASERAEMLDRIDALDHAEQGHPEGAGGPSSGATEDPSPAPQSQPAEDAGRGAAVARAAAPPSDTPGGREKAPDDDVSSDPAPATDLAPAGQGSTPTQPAGVGPAQISDPDTLRTYAAAVLDMDADEVWGLGDLSDADWHQVWHTLELPAGVVYIEWYNALKRPLRQALMSAGQSPRKRLDRATADEAQQAIDRVKAGAS